VLVEVLPLLVWELEILLVPETALLEDAAEELGVGFVGK
jgi:hypothetical protein